MKYEKRLTNTDTFLFRELNSTFSLYKKNYGTALGKDQKMKLARLIVVMIGCDLNDSLELIESLSFEEFEAQIEHKIESILENLDMGNYAPSTEGRV
jgi:hypothetical protein